MKTCAFGLTAAIILALAMQLPIDTAAAAVSIQDPSGFLLGNAVKIDDPALSLEQRRNAARGAFRSANAGDLYFTCLVFPGRSEMRHRIEGLRGPFTVTVRAGEIRFQEGGRSQSFESRERPGPVGLLMLNSLAGPRAGMLSARLIDPEESYAFKTVPAYWLGSAEADPSVAFLEEEFKRGGSKLQQSLVFIISQHDTPRALDFLGKTALDASLGLEVRKDAVFWAGNDPDPRGLTLLKKIFHGIREEGLKEQVVFALTLIDRPEAVEELIRIAKSDPNPEVRKKAVFWLGQKASQAAIGTLKDIVDLPEEDVEVKESALFAISQLPRDKAVPMLADVVRHNQSPAVRKRAIFWLGQVGGEEALELFEEILLKKK